MELIFQVLMATCLWDVAPRVSAEVSQTFQSFAFYFHQQGNHYPDDGDSKQDKLPPHYEVQKPKRHFSFKMVARIPLRKILTDKSFNVNTIRLATLELQVLTVPHFPVLQVSPLLFPGFQLRTSV
jgi:hypothetical protein